MEGPGGIYWGEAQSSSPREKEQKAGKWVQMLSALSTCGVCPPHKHGGKLQVTHSAVRGQHMIKNESDLSPTHKRGQLQAGLGKWQRNGQYLCFRLSS